MYHIIPENDLKEHVSNGSLCPCGPSIIEVEGELILVHNSYDGREALEWANQILKEKWE